MNLESVLLPQHLDQLVKDSGIAPEVIAERGYRSIRPPEGYSALKPHGFTRRQANLPGLLMPLWTIDGRNGLVQYRPDSPRLDKHGKPVKYETLTGAAVQLDCPPRCRPMLADPSIALWVTEGLKKGDALATRNLCAIALLGVWGFKGKNPFGGTTVLADFDRIALNGRNVRIVFDNDAMTKRPVQQALQRLTEHLQRKGAHVTAVYLPQEGGKKIGVDDYLLTHNVQDLEGLVEQPKPAPQPAAPVLRLLDDAPAILNKPLMLLNRRAYAMTWLWVESTIHETLAKDGTIVTLPEPEVTQARRLFVIRDDGRLFGDVSDPKVKPVRDLGITLRAPDVPRDDILWRKKGVAAYRRGARPEVKDTFLRVVAVYDHFLDFSRSVDEQPRMCRLSACLSLMTWFADACTVLPYPWPNSPTPGAGKTKWGHCWVKTSYLGYLTSASGSFAALRDLADVGATILFDDAEGLADLKADPDKQALILAGKGVMIPIKEAGSDGRLHTRWINAYCPRGFTALKLPFRALQSRSIVIPLIASADPMRANRDPENPEDWPCDQRQLRDDLWSMALWLQAEAADVWTSMSKETSTLGRDWERWRALMTVARLLEAHGVEGLERDMRHVMTAYHQQKGELEAPPREALVIRALMRVVKLKEVDMWTSMDVMDMKSETQHVTSTQIVKKLKELLTDDDGADGEEVSTWATPRAVGRLLARLRVKEHRGPPPKRERFRVVSPREIAQLAIAHHIVYLSEETSKTSTNVQTSISCPTCGGSQWRDIPGGDAVCLVCLRKGVS